METLSLNGVWNVCKVGGADAIDAVVPGNVHADLLAAGRIPDPFYRTNEHDLLWIGETDWVYTRAFDVPPELLANRHVLLRCHGLDTAATVKLNGRVLGKTDNQFRTWEFDAKRSLKSGRNTIEITFASAMKYVRERNKLREMPGWGIGLNRTDSGGWLRKQPCNFGWDWGPRLVTCGVWRDIELVAFDEARLSDVLVLQHHEKGRVALETVVTVQAPDPQPMTVVVTLERNGKLVAKETARAARGKAVLELTVNRPDLWWPNGMGDQPLYELTADLLDEDGELIDSTTRRIGLRTLRLGRHPDKWGESFQFTCNGVPFFAKGANWIPGDAILARMTEGDYRRLLGDAAACHMNMLRVWGGGFYENDVFYNLCDELGICVWQDFMFACATYPGFDEAFRANVRAEAEDNVRRIRHHPSIALWCGNNELEQGLVGEKWTDKTMSWEDYKPIFDVLLPDVIKRLDPQRDYWPSSAHKPHGDRANVHNNPACGDSHLWAPWFSNVSFEWYRTRTDRFNSEFGYQSFPEPKTVRQFTAPGDRNVTSPVVEWHQRSGPGNQRIVNTMLEWFRMPEAFENFLWLSQIQQGLCIKTAVEHWRRLMPQGMGTLYWQLNDNWPVNSWSSIDYYGRWKALQYMSRRFFAPVLLSGNEDPQKGTIEVHVTNDTGKPVAGRVEWAVQQLDGARLVEDTFAVKVEARRSRKVKLLDLSDVVAKYGAESFVVPMRLVVDGACVSSNTILLARPKRMDLVDPRLEADVRAESGGACFRVRVSAKAPALWTWLELLDTDARCSDNFFDVMPGAPVTVFVHPARPMSATAFRRQLRLSSLRGTY